MDENSSGSCQPFSNNIHACDDNTATLSGCLIAKTEIKKKRNSNVYLSVPLFFNIKIACFS